MLLLLLITKPKPTASDSTNDQRHIPRGVDFRLNTRKLKYYVRRRSYDNIISHVARKKRRFCARSDAKTRRRRFVINFFAWDGAYLRCDFRQRNPQKTGYGFVERNHHSYNRHGYQRTGYRESSIKNTIKRKYQTQN